jgi:hypothetical protein
MAVSLFGNGGRTRVGVRRTTHLRMGASVVLMALLAASCATPSATRPVILHPKSPAPDSASPSSATSTTPTTSVVSAVPTTAPSPVDPVPGWSAPLTTLPPGGGFTSVSCISDTFCVAAGGGANDADALGTTGSGTTVSWDGAAWSDPSVYYPAPATGQPTAPLLPSIACTGGPLCVIVDGSDHVSTGEGTDWSSPSPFPTSTALLQGNPADPGAGQAGARDAAVTCADPTFCAAVDNTGHAASLVDGRWVDPSTFGTNGVSLYERGLVGITCPTTSMCRAVVGTTVLDWDGNGWSQEPSPWTTSLPASGTGGPQAAAIGCPTTTLCAIVSGGELWVDEPGQPWTPVQTIDPQGGLDSISCPTATFCMAADESGSVLQWDGGSWSAPARVLPAATQYTGDPTTVSCSDQNFCMVLNGDGDYATYSAPANNG